MAESHELLVRAAAQGDARALNALFERHLPDLLAYVRLRSGPRLRALESSFDLVQSACREVLQDFSSVEADDEAGFRRWLFTAAERKIRDRARFHGRDRREASRRSALDSEFSLNEVECLRRAYEGLVTPSALLELREDWESVERALQKLSEEDREVVVLAHLVKLPRTEIAKTLGISEGAVRVRLHRALARLSRIVGAKGEM